MQEKFFIRDTDNIILGPFPHDKLRDMLDSGQLNMQSSSISPDKETWMSMEEFLAGSQPDAPEIPEADLQEQEEAAEEVAETAPEAAPQEISANEDKTSGEAPPVHIDRSFKRISGDTVAIIFNSSSYFERLTAKGSNGMIISGVTAAGATLIITLLSSLLFASRYGVSVPIFYIRSFALVYASGAWFWIANLLISNYSKSRSKPKYCRAETDFMAAMLEDMNVALLLCVLHASLFMWNKTLYQMVPWAGWLLSAVTVFAVIYITGNLFMLLRCSLQKNAGLGNFAASVAAAVELWGIAMLALAMLRGIYCNISL